MENTSKPFYLHYVGEITGLSEKNLQFEAINATFRDLLSKVEYNVIKSNYHEFPGGGLSIVYILSASHLAIHTWPEFGFIHFDLITCSPNADFEEFKKLILEAYPEAEVKSKQLDYF